MKKAQEEMFGFGIIIVLVIVIALVFLWFFLMKPAEQNLEDYETESFIHSLEQYTTLCKEVGRDYLSVNELIYWCYDSDKECEGDVDACEVLNETLDEIIENSWDVSDGSKIKGYSFNIDVLNSDETLAQKIYEKNEGNLSGSSRGYYSEYSKKNKWVNIKFVGYF